MCDRPLLEEPNLEEPKPKRDHTALFLHSSAFEPSAASALSRSHLGKQYPPAAGNSFHFIGLLNFGFKGA